MLARSTNDIIATTSGCILAVPPPSYKDVGPNPSWQPYKDLQSREDAQLTLLP